MYIYVAGPYTKGDTILNIRDALYIANHLRSMGHTPFVPHLTYAWHMIFPHEDVEYWYQYDLEWLRKCDAIYRLPGESTGADKEVDVALEMGIPVFYSLAQVQAHKFMENK